MSSINDHFPSWEAEYNKMQTIKQAKSKSSKTKLLSETLHAKFKINFTKLKSLEELTGLSTDDECEHYIDMKTHNIYSWNVFDNKWEDKVRQHID